MSHDNQRALAIGVTVLLGCLGAVQLASPDVLGITPRVSAWLGIVSVGLGLLASFLPNVRGTSPETLADRVWNLPTDERQAVADDLATRAVHEAESHERRMPHG